MCWCKRMKSDGWFIFWINIGVSQNDKHQKFAAWKSAKCKIRLMKYREIRKIRLRCKFTGIRFNVEIIPFVDSKCCNTHPNEQASSLWAWIKPRVKNKMKFRYFNPCRINAFGRLCNWSFGLWWKLYRRNASNDNVHVHSNHRFCWPFVWQCNNFRLNKISVRASWDSHCPTIA